MCKSLEIVKYRKCSAYFTFRSSHFSLTLGIEQHILQITN